MTIFGLNKKKNHKQTELCICEDLKLELELKQSKCFYLTFSGGPTASVKASNHHFIAFFSLFFFSNKPIAETKIE